MTKFMRGLTLQRPAVVVWVAVLAAINLAGLLFFDRTEARIVVAALVAAGVLMELLTWAQGFTRLLGFGHVLWVPMLVYLWGRLAGVPATEPFGLWLRAVILVNAISLIMDAADVVRYARGERGETVSWD